MKRKTVQRLLVACISISVFINAPISVIANNTGLSESASNTEPNIPYNEILSGYDELKNSLKDPDSIKILGVQLANGDIVYKYTATNSFGGRVTDYAIYMGRGHLVIGDTAELYWNDSEQVIDWNDVLQYNQNYSDNSQVNNSSTSSTAHQHYDINIDNEEILDSFNIDSTQKLYDLADLAGTTSDVFAEKTGVIFDTEHMFESSDRIKYYSFNGLFGEYKGDIEVAVNNADRVIKYISFNFSDEIKPISRDTVLPEATKLANKNPYESDEKYDIWMINNCKMDMLSYSMTDDLYQGVQFIQFWPQ